MPDWDWKNIVKVFAGGAGVAVVLTVGYILISYGEMRSDVRHNKEDMKTQDEKVMAFDSKLDALDEKFDVKFSELAVSQARMEEKLDGFIRFASNNEKGEDSASLVEEGSAKNVSAGMSM